MYFLDVGYSFGSEVGFISNVLNGYFHTYFPRAAEYIIAAKTGTIRRDIHLYHSPMANFSLFELSS